MFYLASSEKHVGKIEEDKLIANKIIKNGRVAKICTLNNIVKTATAKDIVILKSIWGYHLVIEEFLRQLKVLERKNIALVNSYKFVYWNIDKKKYISDSSNDITFVPTRFLDKDLIQDSDYVYSLLNTFKKDLKHNNLVIKPAISASGYNTYLIDVSNKKALGSLVHRLSNFNCDYLVQPFFESICDGEISIISISGELLYGVKRFPGVIGEKKDTEYLDLSKVPVRAIRQAKDALSWMKTRFGEYPIILRIDLIKTLDGDYNILELELIDPDLFFRKIPKGVSDRAVELLVGCII